MFNNRKKSALKYLLLFCFFFLLAFFLSKFFGEGGMQPLPLPKSLSWEDTIKQIPNCLLYSAIAIIWIFFIEWSEHKQERRKQ